MAACNHQPKPCKLHGGHKSYAEKELMRGIYKGEGVQASRFHLPKIVTREKIAGTDSKVCFRLAYKAGSLRDDLETILQLSPDLSTRINRK